MVVDIFNSGEPSRTVIPVTRLDVRVDKLTRSTRRCSSTAESRHGGVAGSRGAASRRWRRREWDVVAQFYVFILLGVRPLIWMADKQIFVYANGARADLLKLERSMVETQRGPLNLET